jgi:serine/threonine protein kinase
MQLGGRGDLKDLLSKTSTPEQWKPETKKTLAQILDTIVYLHSNGITHCDIKVVIIKFSLKILL